MRATLALTCFVVATCGSATTCGPAGSSKPEVRTIPTREKAKPMPRTTELAKALVADAFGHVFDEATRQQTIARIWNEPGNPAALEDLIDDHEAPLKARFIAADVLFARDATFATRHDRREIARIYAAALQSRLPRSANAWGLLWINDTTGDAGASFLALGKAALPVLRELLEDRQVVDWYTGSEEATVGNAAKYRIRDFAAFYLSLIVHKPLPFSNDVMFHHDFAERDAAIEQLVAALPSE